MTVIQFCLQKSCAEQVITGIAIAAFFLFMLLALMQKQNCFPVKYAHHVLNFISAIIRTDSITLILLRGELIHTPNVPIHLIAIGCFIVSPFFYVLNMVIIFFSWIIAMFMLASTYNWVRYGILQITAITVSALVLITRYNMYCNFVIAQEKQKEQESHLRQAKTEAEQANIARNQFLVIMSHEIRSPMHTIIGLTDIVLDTK